jgi:hypothetical protein
VRYLEPGRKRPRRPPRSLARLLWLVAAGLAVALVVQALVR